MECKTARTSRFDGSTAFFIVFSRFGKPGERLGRRLEPLDRAFGQQFGSSEANLDGNLAVKKPSWTATCVQEPPKSAQEPPKGAQEARDSGLKGEKNFLQPLKSLAIRSPLAEH